MSSGRSHSHIGTLFHRLERYIGYDEYMLCLFSVARPGGASRGISGTLGREGWGE
jgi:hypothetical protein